MKGADAGAHADGGINDAKRRHCAQCIAANIPGRVYFQFVQHGVYASVGTSRTEDGRPCRNLRRRVNLQCLTQHALTDQVCAVLALDREYFLAHCLLDSPCLDLFFHNRLQFLEYVKLINLGSKLLNQLSWKRIHKPQL